MNGARAGQVGRLASEKTLSSAVTAAPPDLTGVGHRVFAQIFESLLPLPKHHSQSAQELVKKSTSNPGTGGSNEKAISRKRSARRVELGNVGGIRCRKAGARICTAAAPRSGLHLERLLCRWERRVWDRTQPTFRDCGHHVQQ